MHFDRAMVGTILAMTATATAVAVIGLLLLDRIESPSIVVQVPPAQPITVSIDGAVATPGLYTLDGSVRLQQVIDAAGGLTADANVQGLNLAGRVGNGEHIVIPSDAAVPSEGAATPNPASGDLLNINIATAEQLESLPGIGPVLAQRIVEHRELYGPFATVDELSNVQGITDSLLEQIRLLVTVDD